MLIKNDKILINSQKYWGINKKNNIYFSVFIIFIFVCNYLDCYYEIII